MKKLSPSVAINREQPNSSVNWSYVTVYIDDVQVLHCPRYVNIKKHIFLKDKTYTQRDPMDRMDVIIHFLAVPNERGFIASLSSQATTNSEGEVSPVASAPPTPASASTALLQLYPSFNDQLRSTGRDVEGRSWLLSVVVAGLIGRKPPSNFSDSSRSLLFLLSEYRCSEGAWTLPAHAGKSAWEADMVDQGSIGKYVGGHRISGALFFVSLLPSSKKKKKKN
jgi:hypothetical protein